jgi:hypothetical protein
MFQALHILFGNNKYLRMYIVYLCIYRSLSKSSTKNRFLKISQHAIRQLAIHQPCTSWLFVILLFRLRTSRPLTIEFYKRLQLCVTHQVLLEVEVLGEVLRVDLRPEAVLVPPRDPIPSRVGRPLRVARRLERRRLREAFARGRPER